MLRVRAGDPSAFDKLTVRYRPQVTRVVTHLLGTDRHSDDLAQEVFLRAYRARRNYVATAKFSTWLFRIVNSVVSNARRYLARRPATNGLGWEASCAGPLDFVPSRPAAETPVEYAMRRELECLVRTTVAQLAASQRTAVSLFYFQGLSYAATADAMHISEQALKSLLHRARVKMKQSLTPYLEHA
jgi:RNA polymerase sigma-70 factor (ECF subfamily)